MGADIENRLLAQANCASPPEDELLREAAAEIGRLRGEVAMTEQQKADRDLLLTGTSFMRDGKRIDPATVRIVIPAPAMPNGVEADWKWTLQKAVSRNAGHRCEYRVAVEAVIASMNAKGRAADNRDAAGVGGDATAVLRDFLAEYDEQEGGDWSATWRALAERARDVLGKPEPGDAEAAYLESLSDNPALDGWAPEPRTINRTPAAVPAGEAVAFVAVPDDYRNQASGYRAGWTDAMKCTPQPADGEAVALDFDTFRKANVARCLKWHPAGIGSWSPSDWLTAALGELGELASEVKTFNRERDGLAGNKQQFTPEERRERMAKEAADVVTYIDLFCAERGIDLGAAVVAKFNEVSERVGFPDRIVLAPAPVQAAPQEGAPRWVDDCQGKASYDGALVSVSVRTWPGNYSADNRPSGKIDVLRLGKVVQSIEVSADTETQLRADIESKVAKLAAHPSACELVVDDAMVERAWSALYNSPGRESTVGNISGKDLRAALTAALQHRGDSRGGEAKS